MLVCNFWIPACAGMTGAGKFDWWKQGDREVRLYLFELNGQAQGQPLRLEIT